MPSYTRFPTVQILSSIAGADAKTSLWQVQVVGGGRRAFTFQVLNAAREALLHNPDENVRSLQQLEAQKMVKLIVGAPPTTGSNDQDNVGIVTWNPVLYVAGPTPNTALEFIHLVVQHKVRSGTITMPQFAVQVFADQDIDIQAPVPWQVVPPADMPDPMPSPFLALPPRGRRHVLCQLERQAPEKQQEDTDEEGEGQEGVKYTFSVFGGIYAFRERFEEHSIQGAQVQVDPNTQEYVRMVEFSGLEEGKSSLTDILENCLQQIPVFFINMAGSQDEARVALTPWHAVSQLFTLTSTELYC